MYFILVGEINLKVQRSSSSNSILQLELNTSSSSEIAWWMNDYNNTYVFYTSRRNKFQSSTKFKFKHYPSIELW